MRYFLNGNEIPLGPFKTGEGEDVVSHPVTVLELWPDEDLATIGVTREAQPPPRRLVAKSVIQERVNGLGKLGDVLALLQAPGNAIYYARWFAPDWPNVYADDPDLLTMLEAVGCTADEVAAITAP